MESESHQEDAAGLHRKSSRGKGGAADAQREGRKRKGKQELQTQGEAKSARRVEQLLLRPESAAPAPHHARPGHLAFPRIVAALRAKNLNDEDIDEITGGLAVLGYTAEDNLEDALCVYSVVGLAGHLQKLLHWTSGRATSVVAAIQQIRSPAEPEPGSAEPPTLGELLDGLLVSPDDFHGLERDLATQTQRLGPFAYENKAAIPFVRADNHLYMDLRFADFVEGDKPELAQLVQASDVRMLEPTSRSAEEIVGNGVAYELDYSAKLRQEPIGDIARTDDLISTALDRAYELKPSTIMKIAKAKSQREQMTGQPQTSDPRGVGATEEGISESRRLWATTIYPQIYAITGGRRLRLHVNMGGYAGYDEGSFQNKWDHETGIDEVTKKLKKVHVEGEQVRVIIDKTNFHHLFRSSVCRDIIAALI